MGIMWWGFLGRGGIIRSVPNFIIFLIYNFSLKSLCMTPIHQQLLESLHELEILHKGLAHAEELSIRLADEERELALFEKMVPREQRDIDILEKNSITRLIRNVIGD